MDEAKALKNDRTLSLQVFESSCFQVFKDLSFESKSKQHFNRQDNNNKVPRCKELETKTMVQEKAKNKDKLK